MLSDPQKRAAYDQYGHAGVDPNMRPAAPAPKASAALPRPLATSSATSSAAGGGGRGRAAGARCTVAPT
jgi:molecular chaperone DnaJ